MGVGQKNARTTPLNAKGAVKITLHSANNEIDEKAELTVSLQNPENAVERMFHTLAQRFPPESVLTISPEMNARISVGSSDVEVLESEMGGGESSSVSRAVEDGQTDDILKELVEGAAFSHLPTSVRSQIYDFPPEIVRFLIANDPKYLDNFLQFATTGADSREWVKSHGLSGRMVREAVNLMTESPDFFNWVSRLSAAVRLASSSEATSSKKKTGPPRVQYSKSSSKMQGSMSGGGKSAVSSAYGTAGGGRAGGQTGASSVSRSPPPVPGHQSSQNLAAAGQYPHPVLGPDGSPLYHADGRPMTSTRRQVIGPDGLPVYGQNGEPVFMPPQTGYGSHDNLAKLIVSPEKPSRRSSHYLYDDTGKQVVSKIRKVYGPDGQILLGPDRLPLQIGEDSLLSTATGRRIFFNRNGEAVLDHKNGPLLQCPLGPDGRPVIAAGMPIYASDRTQMVGPDGVSVVCWDSSEGRATHASSGQAIAFGATGGPIFAFSERPIVVESRPVVDENGRVVFARHSNGPLRIGADGRLQSAQGLPLPVSPSGEILDANNAPLLNRNGQPVLATDGRPLLGVGRPIYALDGRRAMTNDGRVVTIGPQGYIEADGRSVFFGPDDSVHYGNGGAGGRTSSVPPSPRAAGGAAAGDIRPDIRPMAGGRAASMGSMQGAMTATAAAMMDGGSISSDRPVYGCDGEVLRGPFDGKPLRYTYDGIITLADGTPLRFDADGTPRLPDGSILLDNNQKPIVGMDGRPLFAPGSPVYGPNGRPLFTTDSQPILYGHNGRMEAADGRLVDFGAPDNKIETKSYQQRIEEMPHGDPLPSIDAANILRDGNYPAGSQVVGSEMVEGERVTYVEVPVFEEKVVHVSKKQIVEVEKKVPRVEIVEVEKIVEVPQVQYVDRQVEVQQIQEVVRHIPRKEVVEVPKEVIRQVPRVEIRQIEKVVEVPGEIIEVPQPYRVENKVPVAVYKNRDVTTVVAQKLQPVVRETNTHPNMIEAKTYEPVLYPVDVFIPKPIPSEFASSGKISESHNNVDIPPAQYNSLLKNMNQGIESEHLADLFVRAIDGSVPLLPTTELVDVVRPASGAFIASSPSGINAYNNNNTSLTRAPTATTAVSPVVVLNETTTTTTVDREPSDMKKITTKHHHHSSRGRHHHHHHHTTNNNSYKHHHHHHHHNTVVQHRGGDAYDEFEGSVNNSELMGERRNRHARRTRNHNTNEYHLNSRRHAYKVERLGSKGMPDRSRIIVVEDAPQTTSHGRKRLSRTVMVHRESSNSTNTLLSND